jgi:dipeptidyl-peptidase-4
MKKILSAIIIFCAGITLSAQNIISTREANPQDGKILTMEEAMLSRSLSPEWPRHRWEGNDTPEFPKEILEGQSLYIAKAAGDTIAVAVSESSQITYGQTVSRNEFGIDGGIFWSPDKSKLAFYRKDESKVTTFPLLDITTRTGSLREIKYPMAGMESENVQLGIYDLASGNIVYADVQEFGYDQYLTNISWSPDASRIFIQVLDRSQKHMKLNMYDSADGSFIKTILTEDNEKYIEPQDPIWFIKGTQNLFIYRTDNRDGYRNLYLCDLEGNVRRLTQTDADVAYVANDGNHVWYTSAEVSPIENHLFRISLKSLKSAASKGVSAAKIGKSERLTTEPGWHTISMNQDCTQYTDTWSSLCVPRVCNLCSSDGKVIKNILTAKDPTLDYAYTEISIGTVKSADGKYDNYFRLIKPKDFDPSKKYPTIVYVYGGPHSQMVQNTFTASLRRWEMVMAQKGYLVYVQDNRGTQNRGAEFEKAIHRQCGQAEMADQMEGVKMLMSLPYVDKDRIGVHGWSYGGFMTISLITNYPEVFKVAVAGGPVIDWKWYEVMYGERYMDNPSVNPEGYAKTSLINKAKDLKGKLLICQGAIDPVVVWEHSLSFIRECIKNNVQVDYFPYPCAEHNVMGKDRVHLHDKITMYFEDYL